MIAENQEELNQDKLEIYILDESHLLYGNVCGYVWGKTDSRVSIEVNNPRKRVTFYGALNYRTKEFILKEYDVANSENAVNFLEYLQSLTPEKRLLIIWDNASFHKKGEIPSYLDKVNKASDSNSLQLQLEYFAPNAPRQNPVEDIWLQGKNFIRKFYYKISSFPQLTNMFFDFLNNRSFSFPKVSLYG